MIATAIDLHAEQVGAAVLVILPGSFFRESTGVHQSAYRELLRIGSRQGTMAVTIAYVKSIDTLFLYHRSTLAVRQAMKIHMAFVPAGRWLVFQSDPFR